MGIAYSGRETDIYIGDGQYHLSVSGGRLWIPYTFILWKKVSGDMDYLLTYYDRGFSGNPYDVQGDRTYSLDALPQEFPERGTVISGLPR